jgi:hypothetical protein
MWIEVEPADFFMFRVSLLFSRQEPDVEDPWVREYLKQYDLEPRRQLEIERDGHPIEVLQYGQCYLGNHAYKIRDLHKRGVEIAALRHTLPEMLADLRADPASGQDLGTEGPDEPTIEALADRVHPEAQFAQDKDGRLIVGVDPDVLRAAYRDVVGAAAETDPAQRT